MRGPLQGGMRCCEPRFSDDASNPPIECIRWQWLLLFPNETSNRRTTPRDPSLTFPPAVIDPHLHEQPSYPPSAACGNAGHVSAVFFVEPVRFIFSQFRGAHFVNARRFSPIARDLSLSETPGPSQPIEAARALNAHTLISCGKSQKMLAPTGGARAFPREHSDYSLLANDLQQKNARAGP